MFKYTERRFQKAIYTALYRHLRVSIFRLENYDTRVAAGGILEDTREDTQPVKTIDLLSYVPSSSYSCYSLQNITKSKVTQPYTVPYWRHCRLACWNNGRPVS